MNESSTERLEKEIAEIKELLQIIVGNQEQNSLSKDEKQIIQLLTTIEDRQYFVSEDVKWLKNEGRHLGDAKGPAGVPGL